MIGSCLIDFIGVPAGCVGDGNPPPPSGLFINDFPGVDGVLLQQLADVDKPGFRDVWRKVEKRAAARFIGDYTIGLSRYRRVSRDFEQVLDGVISQNEFTDGVNLAKVKIEHCRTDYVAIFIESITFYSDQDAGYGYLYITDELGYVVEEIETPEVRRGLNRVKVEREYWSNMERPARYLQLTVANANLAKVRRGGNGWGCGCYDDCRASNVSDQPVEVDLEVYENSAIIVNYRIRCSIERYICEIRQDIAYSFGLLCAMELCKEQLASVKHTAASMNKEEARNNLERLETEYKARLASDISVLLPGVSACFECDGIVSFKTFI